MSDNIKTLYTFQLSIEKEIDETTTREQDGKTISETTKVKKSIPHYIAFKKISRAEREDAEVEGSAWHYEYVKKGLMPEAVLLKTYGNANGILSDDQKKEYLELRVQLKQKLEEEVFLRTAGAPNADKATDLSRDIIRLRDKIMTFEQEQSVFFENTAEAKARLKVAQFLVLHLSYTRASENQAWTPFFGGKTTADKLKDYDAKEENGDELFALSISYFNFLASFLVGSKYAATTDDINEWFKEQNIVS